MSTRPKDNSVLEAVKRIDEAKQSDSTSLNLSDLGLTAAPEALAELTNLRDLDLSKNQITAIPDSLAQLANLRILDLKENQITSIPDSLAQLVNLKFLSLSSNRISVLPDYLAHLPSIESLFLSWNQVTAIPESLAKLTPLTHLYFFGNQITTIPDFIARLANLQTLSLGQNQITAIPESLAHLADLRSLNLFHNQITAIPDSLARLTNLQELNLGFNQITAIPDSLAQLINLQDLNLGRNQITAIPECLAHLTKVTSLSLYSNKVTAIPESLAHLTKLTSLSLYGNQLITIPDFIARLTNLQELDLSNNQITAIPNSLPRLTNLKKLDLSDNPLPEEILAALKGGVPGLFRYLESTAIKKVYPRTVKLVLLGEPKSGKTTLLEALKGNPQPCDESRKETIGVDVEIIEKPSPIDNKPMYLSVWDFAGQHMEHATHQFFLTENAIYLIVWNARLGAESGKHDLWYWLELLKMRVRNPKFLLVATHVEHTPPDLNLSEIERSYNGCQGNFPIELENLKGMDSLRTRILELAADSPSLRAEWPPEWLSVRDEVRKIREKQVHMTPAAFRTLMKKKHVTGQVAQKGSCRSTP